MSDGVPFGNYRLLRRLARGGMAEVFLANQQGVEGFERRVAIKRILPHLSDSAEFRTMFLDEARLAAQLTHPNIIHIYDFGKVDDYYFIAMEYVDGIDLGRLIKQARTSAVPFELIARLLSDVCAGLHYAHNINDPSGKRLNVVHRDVTPQNVLITYDGVTKVVDFGIAKATWQASRTRPGVVKGKYAYMSPEQVEGRQLDARSDIFSVGICMYELMTGMPLYRRDNVTEAMKEIRDGKPIHPEHHRENIPHELMSILKKSLETSREARYASAAAMQLDLERYLKNASELATPQLLGDFLRREAPPGPAGEMLTEGKADPGSPGVSPPHATPSPPPAVAPGKGGTAQMSSVKQAVTPAYENIPLFGSDPAARPSAERPQSGSLRTPGSHGDDLTTPGRSMRQPAQPGFASEEDDDLTRRDDRAPTLSQQQETVRSPKFGDSLDGVAHAKTEISEQRTASGKLAAQPRATKSGQHPPAERSRSGPFPGNPLGAGQPVSDAQHALGDPTSQLDNPKQPRPKSKTPWVVAGLVVLGAALTLASPAVRGKLGLGAQVVTPNKPDDVQPVKVPDPIAQPTRADAAPQVVTTELPVQTSAILGINTRPSGAKVFIDGQALEMLTPVRTQPVTAGPHHVVIERVGYAPREEDISLHAGEHRVLDYELPEERSLQATPPVGKHHGGGSTPRAGGSGMLTARTVPWSKAYDGETLLGETPLVSVPLSEGPHTITFVNPDKGTVKKRVVIKVGEETRLGFTFGE